MFITQSCLYWPHLSWQLIHSIKSFIIIFSQCKVFWATWVIHRNVERNKKISKETFLRTTLMLNVSYQPLVTAEVPTGSLLLDATTKTCNSYFSHKDIREFRARGNSLTFPLTFPLVLREKLREFPQQILFGLREISQTETVFPWADSPGNDKHTSKNKIPQK